MNIGFDLDKIFINTPPLIPKAFVERLYGKKANGKLTYRIPKKPEQLLRRLVHYHRFRPPIKENLTFMQNLAENSTHTYYLISSRYGFLKNATGTIVKKHKLDKLFHDLIFNYDNQQPHLFKDEIIKKKKIDLYVDDDYHLVEYLAQNNKNTRFYWLNKKRNHKLASNLYAITDLSHIKLE